MIADDTPDPTVEQVAKDLEDQFVRDADKRAQDILSKMEIDMLNRNINQGDMSVMGKMPALDPLAVSVTTPAQGLLPPSPRQSAVGAVSPNSLTYKAADRYALSWSDPRANLQIRQSMPNYNICFHNTVDDGNGNAKQEIVGKLDFNGGTVKFEGNFEESAVRFVDFLSNQFSRRLRDEHVAAAKLLAELVSFDLSDEVELDDAYRKGFNDGMQACRAMLLRKAKELEE